MKSLPGPKHIWLMLLASAPLVAAVASGPSQPQEKLDYKVDVEPVLKRSCVPCHNASKSDGELDLSTPAGIRKGGISGPVIVAGEPEESPLYTRTQMEKPFRMPPTGRALRDTKVEILKKWIEEGAELPAPSTVNFKKDVFTILYARCTTCHGGDEPEADLNFESVDQMLAGGVNGDLYIPGDAANSLLIKRLRGLDGLAKMPMGFNPLLDRQIDAIETWINEGASTANQELDHWAFDKIESPAVPDEGAEWSNHPVDRFVAKKLKEKGLEHSAQASRETLIRRLSLDITGLPPTIEEVDAFLADESDNAYDKLVDRLLASPHYGERQALIWLDLARYADTDGYEKDPGRSIYPFRDWVINAFNANMPFDQFTIEQLAGDLLPNPTIDQKIATGFHRNSMFNTEGGVDPGETRFTMIMDRVDTTSSVWMGVSMGCARCHDHKFDPITHKDYYKFYAFYAGTDFRMENVGSQGGEKWYENTMKVPTAEQKAQFEVIDGKLKGLDQALANPYPGFFAEFEAWKKNARNDVNWSAAKPAVSSDGGVKFVEQSDGSLLATGADPDKVTYTLTINDGVALTSGIRLTVLPDDSLPSKGPGRSGGNLVLTKVIVKADGKDVPLNAAVADYHQPDYFPVEALSDGGDDHGWAVGGGQGKKHDLVIGFTKPVSAGTHELKIQLEMKSRWAKHTIGRFKIATTTDPHPEYRPLNAATINALGVNDNEKLLTHYRSVSVRTQPLLSERSKTAKEKQAIESKIPTTLVMTETDRDRKLTAPVYSRGEFLSPTDEVYAAVPESMPQIDSKERIDRLDLAEWLVSADNPLTARVQANRTWHHIFGKGIVKTLEDFGTQGSPPSNEELLDWLAYEFIDSGWDLKALIKTIVTSETYKQTSATTADKQRIDSENIYLSHGPRFRLSAELIRDSALTAAGLLDRKIGGPSVFPKQPPGIWDSPYNNARWSNGKGSDLVRRGLYTYWKRTRSYPAFMAFDATSREVCTPQRIRTNTPLQALTLLNDEAIMDASKALAKIMMSEENGLINGFRRCTSRTPRDAELRRLQALYMKLKLEYMGKPEEAKKLGGSPDEAAWIMTANVILNLDESITKE
jgi:hypothetical protein